MNRFSCEYCNIEIEAKPAHSGKLINCPSCSSELIVPDQILPIGFEYEGFVIQKMMSQNCVWTTYMAVGVKQLAGQTVQLRLPSTFIEQHTTDFHEFCEVITHNSTYQLSFIPELLGYNDVVGHSWFAFKFEENAKFIESTDLTQISGDFKTGLRYIRKIAVGLKSLHDRYGVTADNLAPSNLEISQDGNVRLFDLGLSEFFLGDNSLLDNGLNIWDYRYMSPDFVETGGGQGIKDDMYALGAVLYTLITGAAPFEDIDPEDIINELCPDLLEFDPTLPQAVVTLFENLFNKYAYKRPETWVDALNQIDKALDSDATEASANEAMAPKLQTRRKSTSRQAIKKSIPARRKMSPRNNKQLNSSSPKRTASKRYPTNKQTNTSLIIVLILGGLTILVTIILLINSNNERKLQELDRKAKREIKTAQARAKREAKKAAAIKRQKDKLTSRAKKALQAQSQAAKKAIAQAQSVIESYNQAQVRPQPAVQRVFEEPVIIEEQAEKVIPPKSSYGSQLQLIANHYESNPTDYDEVILRYEALIETIIHDKNFEQLKLVQPKLDAVIELRDKKVSQAMNIIKSEIRPMIESQNYKKAIKYLEKYEGNGASLTKERREGIIELLQRKLNGE